MYIQFLKTKDGELRSLLLKNPVGEAEQNFINSIAKQVRAALMKPENYANQK